MKFGDSIKLSNFLYAHDNIKGNLPTTLCAGITLLDSKHSQITRNQKGCDICLLCFLFCRLLILCIFLLRILCNEISYEQPLIKVYIIQSYYSHNNLHNFIADNQLEVTFPYLDNITAALLI